MNPLTAFKEFGTMAFGKVFTEGFDFSGYLGMEGHSVTGLVIAFLTTALAFCMVDMFDTMGTLWGACKAGNLLTRNEKGEESIPSMDRAMLADAIATCTGAVCGTSTVTTFVESSSGVAAGARTGLSSMFTAALFLIALFFAPVAALIPACAYAAALIYVGILMMGGVRDIDWHDPAEALPAFLTLVMMPFTYNISYGIAFGLISYVLVKLFTGKVKEINDMRDESDLSGLKLTIDLKRGVDPDKLMAKLYRLTPLQDTVSCNFNILIAGQPRVLGVGGILEEWTAWRTECVKRRVYFILKKKQDKLHLLQGLKRILLDIDKAIRTIRETEEEAEVIPNLMIAFGIDQVQAEYVAEIKLRNINKEYILKRVAETETLADEIADLEDTLARPQRIRRIIIDELTDVRKKYAIPRHTEIVYGHELPEEPEEEPVDDYPVHLFLSREGYFKKITPQSLRMSGDQKYKEGDGPAQYFESTNAAELLFFTDRQQVYKARASEFGETKASALGDYLPAKLGMEDGENVIYLALAGDYSGFMLFFFENGKAAKVPLTAYATTSNRRRLTGAYSDKAPLTAILAMKEDEELALYTNEPRCLLMHTASLSPKTTRATQGVAVMTIKPKYHLERVVPVAETGITNPARYRTRTIPAAGALVKPEDSDEKQITLL